MTVLEPVIRYIDGSQSEVHGTFGVYEESCGEYTWHAEIMQSIRNA